MKVFVLSHESKPLMPTTPRRARLWLATKRARVVNRDPFTLQLRCETREYLQPVTVGVDTGSHTMGIAAIANEEVLVQAEVHLRTDIGRKLLQRRQYRRTRRARKTRYRSARFANRRRTPGWLPPSVRSKVEATLKAVRLVRTWLPVSQVKVEVGSFDTQKMQCPEIEGRAYQQGALQGYLLREYLLEKWQRTCVYCGARDVPLQIEHLIPKSRGGSDRVANLTLACEPCNKRKGNHTAAEFGYPHLQTQATVPLRDAAHVSSLKTALVSELQQHCGAERVALTYGYETKYQRIQVLALAKSHANDAVAIACERGTRVKPLAVVYQIRCVPRGQYQLYNGKRSEHRVWAPRKVKGWKLYEVVQAKEHVGYIGGRRLKGAFVVKDPLTSKTLLEITPSKLVRMSRPTRGWIMTRLSHHTKKEERASSPA